MVRHFYDGPVNPHRTRSFVALSFVVVMLAIAAYAAVGLGQGRPMFTQASVSVPYAREFRTTAADALKLLDPVLEKVGDHQRRIGLREALLKGASEETKARFYGEVRTIYERDLAQPDMAFVSACRAFADDVTLEELGDAGNPAYGPLDLKLAEGMTVMLDKAGESARQLRDVILQKRHELTKKDLLLTGRQTVKLFMQYFKTFDNSEIMYSFVHLATLEVSGTDLHDFVTRWNKVLDNITDATLLKTNPHIIRDPFYMKVKHCPHIAKDIAEYERKQRAAAAEGS